MAGLDRGHAACTGNCGDCHGHRSAVAAGGRRQFGLHQFARPAFLAAQHQAAIVECGDRRPVRDGHQRGIHQPLPSACDRVPPRPPGPGWPSPRPGTASPASPAARAPVPPAAVRRRTAAAPMPHRRPAAWRTAPGPHRPMRAQCPRGCRCRGDADRRSRGGACPTGCMAAAAGTGTARPGAARCRGRTARCRPTRGTGWIFRSRSGR